MLQRFWGLFYSQPSLPELPQSNKLKVQLMPYHILYESGIMSGSGSTYEVNENTCDQIREEIYIVPGKNPAVIMTLKLSGHWDGKEINVEFKDINSLQGYLESNAMINSKKMEAKGEPARKHRVGL